MLIEANFYLAIFEKVEGGVKVTENAVKPTNSLVGYKA